MCQQVANGILHMKNAALDQTPKILDQLLKERSTSLSALCERAGVNYKTLHGQITNSRRIPFETLDSLAAALGTSVAVFSRNKAKLQIVPAQDATTLAAQRAADAYSRTLREAQMSNLGQSGGDFDTDDILDWLRSEGNRLQNFDAIRDQVDLFEELGPHDRMLKPIRCGRTSLATRYFRVSDEAHFVDRFSQFDQKLIEAVLQAHRNATGKTYQVSDVSIDVEIDGTRIDQTYRRIIAPVTDPLGARYSLVFSRLTPRV